jgi:dynein heavy chain
LLANKDKLIVFGGWNFILQFNNIFIYDLETETWEDPEINHEIPKWNLNGILAPSIPSWKYFIFGGSCGNFFEGSNRTGSKYVNDTWYLDVDSLEWVPVKLEENEEIVPSARESPATFYSLDDQRIYVFGGWANDWLNDMWMLPVGNITGPPYAITSIKPTVGPVTGKTKLSIFGAGFKESYGNITVRFFGGKTPIDAQGVFKDENLIECETPSFENFGPKKCEIRVMCGRYDLTITSAEFTYYLNTKADQTICFGPGLLEDNYTEAETMFIIQSRNSEGANRTTGSDEFKVKIKRLDIEIPEEEPLDAKKQKEFDELP